MNMQPPDMKAPTPDAEIAIATKGPASSGAGINVDLPKIDFAVGRWGKGLLVGLGIHAAAIGMFFIATTISPTVNKAPPLALNIDLMPVQTSPVEKTEDQPLDVKKTNFVPTPVEPEPEEVEEPKPEIRPEVALPKPVKKKKKVVKKVTLKKPVEKRPPEKERRAAPAPVKAEKVESTAQQVGVSAEALAAEASWQQQLRSYLENRKRYPSRARRRRHEGVVSVSFTVDRQGNVTEVKLEESSSHKVLDDHILELLKRASPLPAPPVDVEGSRFPFVLPFAFYIKS